MAYKIAHLSDLHITRSIEECVEALYKDLQPTREKIEKEKRKLKEMDEQKFQLLASKLTVPTPPEIPLAVEFPLGSFTGPRMGPKPQGPTIMIPGERTYAVMMKNYKRELESWKEIAGKLEIPIKDCESKLKELEQKRKAKVANLQILLQELEKETQKLQDSLIDQFKQLFYRHAFPRNLFKPLSESIKHRQVDHITVTGDITNFSRKLEYQDFLSGFAEWVDKQQISVVPGNHDTKYFASSISFVDGLGSMIPDEYPSFLRKRKKSPFPYVKELGENICLISLNSTKDIKSLSLPESLITNSRGCFSKDQFKELEEILANKHMWGKFIIVAIHHHLIDVSSYASTISKRFPYSYYMDKMEGCDELLDLLKKHGVQLILNGHIHYPLHVFATKDRPEILTADTLCAPFDGIPKYHLVSIENGHMTVSTVKLKLT